MAHFRWVGFQSQLAHRGQRHRANHCTAAMCEVSAKSTGESFQSTSEVELIPARRLRCSEISRDFALQGSEFAWYGFCKRTAACRTIGLAHKRSI